jgi:hypothetical protein
VSISHRDQRGRVYGYSDVGTGGLMDSKYTFLYERWCRKEPPSGKEVTTGLKAEHRIDAVWSFDDHVVIPENGALKINGEVYLVRAVMPRRVAREVQVYAELVRGDQSTVNLAES